MGSRQEFIFKISKTSPSPESLLFLRRFFLEMTYQQFANSLGYLRIYIFSLVLFMYHVVCACYFFYLTITVLIYFAGYKKRGCDNISANELEGVNTAISLIIN